MRKRVVMLLLSVSVGMSIVGCGGEKEKTYTQSEVDAMMEEKKENRNLLLKVKRLRRMKNKR